MENHRIKKTNNIGNQLLINFYCLIYQLCWRQQEVSSGSVKMPPCRRRVVAGLCAAAVPRRTAHYLSNTKKKNNWKYVLLNFNFIVRIFRFKFVKCTIGIFQRLHSFNNEFLIKTNIENSLNKLRSHSVSKRTAATVDSGNSGNNSNNGNSNNSA